MQPSKDEIYILILTDKDDKIASKDEVFEKNNKNMQVK